LVRRAARGPRDSLALAHLRFQVTQKLLEAETKKLKTLESEYSKTANEQSAALLGLRQMAQKYFALWRIRF